MKKLLIAALAAVLVAASAFAQDGKSIYNKYSGKNGVESVYISPAMFKMVGQLPELSVAVDSGDGTIDIAPILKSLDGMYILSSTNQAVNSLMAADVADFVKKNKFELLMDAKDGEETVSMYTLPDKKEADFLNGFLMISTEPGESTFIYIAGTMSRSDFEALMSSAMGK